MLKPVRLTYGSDPELFFERGGKIVGAEKVIPEQGLIPLYSSTPHVVLDGVQVELNPLSARGPYILGNNISSAFNALRKHLAGVPGITACFRGVVEVEREELDSLSEKSRILGCAPSKNIYDAKPIDVDPLTYRKRSAGGHIHLGLKESKIFNGAEVDERGRLVPLLDIFVGNLGVLLDRDPGAAERRENYGRAGEYRLPPHGLEYRTLSNFWIRNYALMSLMFGMAHVAVSALNQTLENGINMEQELVDTVNIDRVIEAINRNDWDLALLNFNDIRPFLAKYLPIVGFPLTPYNLDRFLAFAWDVRDKGSIDPHFPADSTINHWCSKNFLEFEEYLNTI